jgi:hypothetical protein
MRLARLSLFVWIAALAAAQQPIAMGPDQSAGVGLGVVKYLDWYAATPSGCTNGAIGHCVGGGSVIGDTMYWTAWLPNASGLPVTSGLPIAGTLNDFGFAGCSGNLMVTQLDTFSWASPNASHMSKVNCMTSFGTGTGTPDTPAGWFGMGTSGSGSYISWKSRVIFSKGGILYLPVERQVGAGGASTHDATMIMSPDSGQHWCNPYTYFHRTGSPGCDSSNWSADGDAPRCDAASAGTACLNAAYLDSAHSSIMWKAISPSAGFENWSWVNYGYQDGSSPPAGIDDGCDPSTYTCFYALDYTLTRVPNASIMDVSAWQYYTCPAITLSYRCRGSNSGNWTSTFADRTQLGFPSWYGGPYDKQIAMFEGIMYLKEFKSYVMTGSAFSNGVNSEQSTDWWWAPAIQGPWTQFHRSLHNVPNGGFHVPAPAIGYNVIGTNPPHIQLGSSQDDAGHGTTPQMALWDLVLGNTSNGESFQSTNITKGISGAGYQFSDGHMPGSFPRNGLVWSFDFYDQHVTPWNMSNWPYWIDRGTNSAIMQGCFTDGGPQSCGVLAKGNAAGTYGITLGGDGYSELFKTFAAYGGAAQNAPAAMQGNGSYSVVGIFRGDTLPAYNPRALWATGNMSATTGSGVGLEWSNGTGYVSIDWGNSYNNHYRYMSSWAPTAGNWYFMAAVVTSGTPPTAKLWVGVSGGLSDKLNGVPRTATGGSPASTPNVTAGPLVLGFDGTGRTALASYATVMVYGRALTSPEVQLMYRSFKAKMAERGVTLQ